MTVVATATAILALAFSAVISLGLWVSAAVTVIAGALLAIDLLLVARSRSQIRAAQSTLQGRLINHSPRFALYWDAGRGTAYQLTMWLPLLHGLGCSFVVILRDQASFDDVVRLTPEPIVLCEEQGRLDDVVVPSLTAVFYVNNAISNANMVRYAHLWHLQLNHGESDKAPSSAPTLRMYDRDFVAGPAAVERFSDAGVATHKDFFEIVGRPQTADIAVGPRQDDQTFVVLYAPTWEGFNADSAHSSLPHGVTIVEAMLRHGMTVLFRPHPHTHHSPELSRHARAVREMLEVDRATSGRAHEFDADRTLRTPFSDDVNASDALVGDISSVVADYLASDKPFAMAWVGDSTPDAASAHSWARGGDVFATEPSAIDSAIGALRADPHRDARDELRRAYLATDTVPDPIARFTERALFYVDAPKLGASAERRDHAQPLEHS